MRRRLVYLVFAFVTAEYAVAAPPKLRVHPDGTFKILALSDFHYTPAPDRYGLELTAKLISLEKPDLVILDGDNVSGDSCASPEDFKRAVANVASAMEEAGVPWAMALGNHDGEHIAKTGITRQQMVAYYEAYPHNLNGGWARNIHGAGNKNILIWRADGAKPVFSIWLLDSGESVPERDIRYDWIHSDQTAWYFQTSTDLERRYGHRIFGFMFFHIPVPEFHEMFLTRKTLGERHEPESPSGVNGGLFAAVLERGDVKGIFCGHDHVNNYVGMLRGITLGQVGVAGYHGYPHTPPEDRSNDRARGGRVILLQVPEEGRFKTWMRFRDGSINWESWSDAYEKDQIK